jgi:multidrug resistance efflux pump
LAFQSGLLAFAVGGTAMYMNSGSSGLLLRADGHAARERVAVAPAFEGRVAEVFVRPGDHVEKGQKVAVVKSVAVGRTLADLEAEKARLTSKIAELEARRKVILDTLPLAKANAERAASYLEDLNRAQATGLAVRKSLQEMTSASLSAAEHATSLRAEQDSLSAELEAHGSALKRVTSAYNELSATYADGALYASVSGDIGATVAPVGQTLSTGSGAVADIFAGKSFVLAYLPDSYLFDISEGQTVAVKAPTEILNGRVDRILPLAQNLPSDLQLPNRALERGRMVRIALPTSSELPIDQRVRVTGCLLDDCRVGLMQAALLKTRSAVVSLYQAAMSIGTEAKGLVERLASARHSNGTL